MTPKHVNIIHGAIALNKGLTEAGLIGPITVWLTPEDGAIFTEAANNSIKITEREGVCSAVSADVTFKWRPSGDDVKDGGGF